MSQSADIFGHTWTDIRRAQQGGSLSRPIGGAPVKPMATADDLTLLDQHGEDGLAQMGFAGVLDRLRNSGVVS